MGHFLPTYSIIFLESIRFKMLEVRTDVFINAEDLANM